MPITLRTLSAETAAVPPVTREGLIDSARRIAADLAGDAARRERDRVLPFDIFQQIKEARLGTLRVPQALGGPGGSISDYIEVLMILGAADSNVPHALRSHFNFTEGLVLGGIDSERDRRLLAHVLDGKLFGGAHTEQGTHKPGDITTRLTREGENYRLNGRKWYATGTAFADFASFSALDEEGNATYSLIPVDRQGITVLDDWDGMGQRMTASGGVLLENVLVLASEVSGRTLGSRVGRHCSTMRQLHLAASAAGAVQGAVDEGIRYVQRQARAAAHSAAETARQDPFVQNVVGELSAAAFAVQTLIREAARTLDRTVAAFATGDEDAIETALTDSALTTSRVQIVTAQLALSAATQVFELGGGSATSRDLNLDRYWRNIRTVYNHNPLLHKARVVGDFYLNGTKTHLLEGRVF
ncbi:Acyl-CoA dehydrogenase [Rhizobium sp. RU35A]|uniref:acyl-CoA dehydrogenase family protein n=1 Tax=Rhizobium sp. RU35A TaxID=1907414 RepID=UPI0009571F9E|nr:acyl-CoA dehydrogenase family protein [Rhizobium sp. RU35A]SIQ96124.1 Acyl-CoA dehydrogenase [Rhizobium sp. RU35A]